MAARRPKIDRGFPCFDDDDNAPREAADANDAVPLDMIPDPIGYRVIVRPKPAAKQIGMIALAARTKNADLATRTIGQLLKIGALAFKANMDGLDYKTDPTASGLKAGDWVIFRQGAAQKIKIGRRSGEFDGDEDEDQYLLLMSDTDILAKLTPEQADRLYDWIS